MMTLKRKSTVILVQAKRDEEPVQYLIREGSRFYFVTIRKDYCLFRLEIFDDLM
jgi:hypothetical protein